MKKTFIHFVLLCTLVGTAFLIEADDVFYYRYKDENGDVVITNALPPEIANLGYQRISPRGTVIETILPRKSDAELAQDKIMEKQKQAMDDKKLQNVEAIKTQARKDKVLLESFASVEDIIRSRDENVASINVLEEITQSNIKRLRKQLADAQTVANNYLKLRSTIPQDVKQTIDSSLRQIEESEAFLERKAQEKEKIKENFQTLIDRFKEIQSYKNK